MEKVAVLGAAGAVGRAVIDELNRRAIGAVALGRTRGKLDSAFAGREAVGVADFSDPESTARALEGCDAAIYAVGVDYTRFDLHPALMRSALEAARRAGVERMVVVSSVYSYGHPRGTAVDEDHPRDPETKKGRYRLEQEDAAIEAGLRSSLRTAVLHLPDFYGPHADNSLAGMIAADVARGRPANWLGDPAAAHEFVYVPDTGPVLVRLLECDGAFGRRWNLAGPGSISGADFIGLVAAELGRKARIRTVTPWMLRLLGLFQPLMRELVEMEYLGRTPVLLDDSRLEQLLGSIGKTSYLVGVSKMVAHLRERQGK